MSDKVTIQLRALIQRINRKLKPDRVLKSSRRSAAMMHELGEYYVLDVKRRKVVERNVNLIRLAQEVGAIDGWEELAGD